jgi:hypothetical protein
MIRMDQTWVAERIAESKPEGRRKARRSRPRWAKDAENDLCEPELKT